jgi:hypothetical protein
VRIDEVHGGYFGVFQVLIVDIVDFGSLLPVPETAK